MRATPIEYRLRFLLHILIFLLGLWPFWENWLGITAKSTWLTGSALLAKQGWLGFQPATLLFLILSLLFLSLGAWFRLWGTAYLGVGTVTSSRINGISLLADGPLRRTRNPLYLGTLLHTIGLALLMPPAGAVFAIAAVWVLELRLTFAEESALESKLGQPYLDYLTRVPRFLPAPTPQVPATGQPAHWFEALLGESYFVGVLLTFLVFGWNFNATPLYQGILISLGLAIVLQALIPKRTISTGSALPETVS